METHEVVEQRLDELETSFRSLQEAAEDISEEDLQELTDAFDKAERLHQQAVTAHERAVNIADARKNLPVAPVAETPERTDARVKSEPRTYEKDGPHSMFRDLWNARQGQADARERLDSHTKEMQAEGRAISTTDGSGGEFVPPVWLQEEWIKLPRAGRPVANSLNSRPLPPGTDTINIPKVSAGATTAVQTDGGAVSSTDITTTSVTGAVQTVAGQQDVSQQLVDLSVPGIDVVIFDDLTRAYDTTLDVKVLSGTVTNAKGLDQVASVNTRAYTDASPTVPELYPKLAAAIADVAAGIYMPATCIAMTPLRWAWILASLDTQNRPLVVPVGQPGFNAAAVQGRVAAENVVGTIMGLPVIIDANIVQTRGAGTNEDEILVYRQDQIFLYESAPRLRVFEEVLSNTLQVRFQLYGYYCIIAGRLPKAITLVQGTGLTAPTF